MLVRARADVGKSDAPVDALAGIPSVMPSSVRARELGGSDQLIWKMPLMSPMVSWRMNPSTSHAAPMMMPASALLFWKPARREMMYATMLRTRPMVEVHGMIAKISPTMPEGIAGICCWLRGGLIVGHGVSSFERLRLSKLGSTQFPAQRRRAYRHLR